MKTRDLFQFILISIFALTSCETTEKIDDFPLRPSQLVVNCFFTEGGIWEFQVSKSLSVLDNAPLKLIDNATIKLFKDSELVETLSDPGGDTWYRSQNNLPEIGHEYSIEVSAPDFASLKANEITPEAVPVSNVTAVIRDSTFYIWDNHYGGKSFGGKVEGYFNIMFSDPIGIENYYQLSIFYMDTTYNEEDSLDYDVSKNNLSVWSSDNSVEEGEGYNTNLLISDYLFDGQDYKLEVDFHEWRARKGRIYFIELTSITRSGYLYRRSIDEYSKAVNDPFAEPVKIFCNIENGYGIFSGYATEIYPVSFW